MKSIARRLSVPLLGCLLAFPLLVIAPSGSSDDVTIANGHTVTLDTNRDANNLMINSGGTLDLSGRKLNLGNNGTAFTNNGTLQKGVMVTADKDGPALAATFNDDFSSGLRPNYWSVAQTTPGLWSVDDTQGDVRLAKVGTNPGGFQNVAVKLNMAAVGGPISGDFSEQIDFRDAVVGPNQDQIELHVHFQDGSFFFLVYQTGPNVHVWIGSEHGTTAVNATAGTFKISRSGSTLTGAYNGSPIFSESNTSPVTAIEFTDQLQPGSNDNTSVTFDNFSLTAASVPTACTPPPSGLVSWWPGDGNANDIQDGNSGTLQNGVMFVPGVVGQAFHFDRTKDQFVQTTNASNLSFERTNAFSIDAWVRTTETAHDIFIASKQPNSAPFHGYGLVIANGEQPACDASNPTAAGAGQLAGFLDGAVSNTCPPDFYISVRGSTHLNDGNWHHVAMTYDGSSSASGLKLYVDGAPETAVVQEDTLDSHSILNSAPFTIGSRNGGVPFNGDIDEVEVFNRALSATDVANIVNAGSFGKCRSCTPAPSGMVSWWPGNGNANDIQDSNNGTPMNGATFAPGLVGQAFSFDGTDDFVQVPDAANIRFGLISPMTVDLWVYRTSSNPVQHFIGKRASCNGDGNGTYQMGVAFGDVFNGTCGVFFGHPDSATVCSGTDLPLNTWTHLAGTFDGTTLRIYINGQLMGSLVGILGPSNTAPLLIGATSLACNSRPQGGEPTGGLIDEVEIFNRALSQSEIQAIVDAGNAGKCKIVPCTITCPPNQTANTGPGATQCCAAVNYPAPTTTDNCGTVTCSPASGSCFPVGTTTVSCNTTAGPSCSFTVTVVDNTPPVITCPASVNAVAMASCPIATSANANFTVTATDNCPGVTVVCKNQNNQVVTSGQPFPVGTTTVTCTATDASGNTASCSFTVTTFSFCLQDETNPGNFVLINASTGEYRFFCNGVLIASGTGTLNAKGCEGTIEHNKGDRRVFMSWDTTANGGKGAGTAIVQLGVNNTRCQITDKDMSNNTCTAPGPVVAPGGKGGKVQRQN